MLIGGISDSGNTQVLFETRSIDRAGDKIEEKNKLTGSNNSDQSESDKKRVEELKRIDAKVRAHESAHLAAGGQLVRGGANFKYTTGPDGKQYAISGEVQIDTSEVPDDPEATARKMQQVRRAALAPADPSAQDLAVAQAASLKEAQAIQEAREKNTDKMNPVGTMLGRYKQSAGVSEYQAIKAEYFSLKV